MNKITCTNIAKTFVVEDSNIKVLENIDLTIEKGDLVAISGQSGAGKSTTMALLQEKGFPSIGDDIANLFIQKSKVYVHPCFPNLKLWRNAFQLLNRDVKNEDKVKSDMDKYLVPMSSFHNTPTPVKRIYLLKESEDDSISFNPIQGATKMNKLKNNSYKPWMVERFNLQKSFYSRLMQIGPKIELVELIRPKNPDQLEDMLEGLIKHIKS